jgi:hypothetical protein
MSSSSSVSDVGGSCISSAQFFDGVGKAKQVVSPFSGIASTTRAFVQMAEASQLNQKLAPLQIVTLLRAPFETITIAKNLVEIVKAPSYLKTFALLEFIQSSGNILDYFNSSIWLAEQMGATGLEALQAASTPIGAAALGFQAVGIGIVSWKIYEIVRVWNKVEHHLDNQDYQHAIDVLTEEPIGKMKRYREKFFGVLSDNQKTKILDVYNHVHQDESNRAKLFDTVKDHYFQKKVQSGISLALMIIGIIGVAVASFAAVACAPIAWGVLGGVGVLSLALFAYSIYKDRSFNQALLKQVE